MGALLSVCVSGQPAGGTDTRQSFIPPQDSYPTWVPDEEAPTCYECRIPFDMVRRKHHCRRCRNVFCEKCSSKRDRCLIMNEREPVRLCDRCCVAAQEENEFFDVHRPLLRKGQTFQKKSTFSRKDVFVQLHVDNSTLLFEEPGSNDRKMIPLEEIISIVDKSDSVTSLEITTRRQKVLLQAGSQNEKQDWVKAANIAVKFATEPSLKEQVDAERQKRIEEEARANMLTEAEERRLKRQAEREAFRNTMKGKYTLTSPGSYTSLGK